MTPRFKVAWGPWRWLLCGLGFGGIAVTPRRVYLLAHSFDDETLRRHELVHVEQMQRDGVLSYWARYFFEWMRHGYYGISYEIEARQHEGD